MTTIEHVFKLAGWTPAACPRAELELLEIERKIGRRLPGLFRDLLSLANGTDLLAHFSNCDRPIARSQLGDSVSRWPSYDPPVSPVLPFMLENQGVCTWAFALDEGDDPAVLVEVDSGPRPEWQPTGVSLSTWLECQIHDWLLLSSARFAAQAEPLTDDVVAALRRRFRQGVTTFAWPGEVNYRFSNIHGQLLLWFGRGQCDWWIAPADQEPAISVLDDVRDVKNLAADLYALRPGDEAALEAWKRGLQ